MGLLPKDPQQFVFEVKWINEQLRWIPSCIEGLPGIPPLVGDHPGTHHWGGGYPGFIPMNGNKKYLVSLPSRSTTECVSEILTTPGLEKEARNNQ